MTRTEKKRASTALTGIVMTLSIMSLVPIALEYLVNKWRDPDYWLEYITVEPILVGDSVRGPTIDMQTVAMIHRPVDIQHHDTLFCRNPDTGRIRFISEQRTEVRHITPTLMGFDEAAEGYGNDGLDGYERVDGEWEYAERLPTEPTMCQITANPTVVVSPGVEKRLQLTSQFFPIDPR